MFFSYIGIKWEKPCGPTIQWRGVSGESTGQWARIIWMGTSYLPTPHSTWATRAKKIEIRGRLNFFFRPEREKIIQTEISGKSVFLWQIGFASRWRRAARQ